MVVSGVVQDDHYAFVSGELAQQQHQNCFKSFGVERFAQVVCEFPCLQAHGTKTSNRLSCRGMGLHRVRLRHLWSRFAQAKSQLPENALALRHTQSHLIALLKVGGQQLDVPQVSNITETGGAAPQIAFQSGSRLGIQTGRSYWRFTVAHAIESVLLKALKPALNSSTVFAKEIGNLLAALTTRQQQQAVSSLPIELVRNLTVRGVAYD